MERNGKPKKDVFRRQYEGAPDEQAKQKATTLEKWVCDSAAKLKTTPNGPAFASKMYADLRCALDEKNGTHYEYAREELSGFLNAVVFFAADLPEIVPQYGTSQAKMLVDEVSLVAAAFQAGPNCQQDRVHLRETLLNANTVRGHLQGITPHGLFGGALA